MVRCRAVKITCGCRYRDTHQPPLTVDCSHAQGAPQRIGDDADDLDPVLPSPVKLSIIDILSNAEAKPGSRLRLPGATTTDRCAWRKRGLCRRPACRRRCRS